VRVLPDEPAIDRLFDYLVPTDARGASALRVGSEVRVPLHGRRVGAWVVDTDVDPPAGLALARVAKIRGLGPSPEVVELCRWVAHRWGGRWASVLRFASPSHAVLALERSRSGWSRGATTPEHGPDGRADAAAELAGAVLADAAAGASARRWRPAVVRWPPAMPLMPLVRAVTASTAGHGTALVVLPDAARVDAAARRLRADGLAVAVMPSGWVAAATGTDVVIGARGAVFAPADDLAAVLVIDEHDDTLQDERVPTWHARDVAVERARCRGIPCVLASPCPTPEAVSLLDARSQLVTASRAAERAGWAPIRIVDRGTEDPRRRPLIAEATVESIRGPGRVLCVLNRTGDVRLSRCRSCRALARCERCGAAVARRGIGDREAPMICRACGEQRPPVCLTCGGGAFAVARGGSARAQVELETLLGEPVGEVTAETDELPAARVLVGTEAVLRRVERADGVVFLDADAELLAPRFRAAEQTLVLLAMACRAVGGRSGRVVVQTANPGHEVLVAARGADPGRLLDHELQRRSRLRLPPFAGLARISGPGAPELAAVLARLGAEIAATDPRGRAGAVLVRAESPEVLADLLDAARHDPARGTARARVEVDPQRV
jgi:primosomal protein N' (replication factor Y)